MSVCTFSSFPNGKYSNIFNAVTFSSNYSSGKTYFPVKSSYLQTFPDYKV